MPGYSVVGIARSGVAAANALARRGEDVLLADLRTDGPQLERFLAKVDPRVEVRLGGNHFRPGDCLVVSPGIPPRVRLFEEAVEAGCEVIGEIALFQRLSRSRTVACVTGTDGKSTTTAWLGAMCKASGRPTWVGGNIGIPLTAGLDEIGPAHIVVAEVSCFQLWTSSEWSPRVAVLTNIAEDHLDYFDGDFDRYIAAKKLVAANLGPGDTLVANLDDPILESWTAPPGAQTLGYSRKRALPGDGTFVQDDQLCYRRGHETARLAELDELPIPGAHNVENALAAAAGAIAIGVPVAAVQEGLRTFPGLEHRIELVRTIDGVPWFNDSKATNPHAGEAALRAWPGRPLILLAGGSEKGSDFGEWAELARTSCRHVVGFGQTGDRIVEALGQGVPTTRVETLDQAITIAHGLARAGDVVALSPVCASFDQFRDFEHRGAVFKALVGAL